MKLNIPIGQEFLIDPKTFKQRGLGIVGWTKIRQKKTWPKVRFARFIMCTMLTHDDDKIISIHS
jgi:hypothetical protein